jgi:NADPH2:quinone reductase
MRALVVSELGAPPEIREVAEPIRGEGEALLEMLAAPLNPIDLSVASGRFFAGCPPVPYVAGAEGAGRIVESDRHAAGTIVWTGMQGLGVSRDGVVSERAVARDDGLVQVPSAADPALAAALGIAGLAGWLPLAWRSPVRPDDRVVVLGATGTLGLVAVQAARLLGAARIVAVGRRPAGLERAARAGADATVRLDEPGDLAERLRDATGGAGPTLVVDPLWGEPVVAAMEAAAPRARILQLGQSAGAAAAVPSGAVRGKELEILGYTSLRVPFDVLADGYRTLVEHAVEGRITIDLDRLGLDEAGEAWARQSSGADSKLVICPAE